MAGVAGETCGVIGRRDLREAFRLGRVGLVTAGTHHGRIQLCGMHRTGIVGVLGQGSVTSLASDHHMLAQLFLFHHVGMAGLAGLVPRKRDRSGRDLADRRTSVVTVLAKTVGHYRGPQNHECRHRDDEHDCQTNEVFDILKQVCVPCVLTPATICARSAQCTWIPEILLASDD